MANQNDFIVKYGLVVENTSTIGSANNLVTTNVARTTARPSLDLNFTRSAVLDSRVTFNRNSLGTYIDRSGTMKIAGPNVPRFDYDSGTGQSNGLLVEEQRANLFPRSLTPLASFAATPNTCIVSTDIQSILPNATVLKSVRDVGTADNNIGYTSNVVVLSTGTFYTVSAWVYVPASTLTTFTSVYLSFEVAGGTTIVTSADPTKTNQWQRIWSTGTNSTNTTSAITNCLRMLGGTTGTTIYSTCYQLEVGTWPSSYIPTNNSGVTRLLDTVQLQGQNFNSWYNPRGGTLLADFQQIKNVTNRGIVAINDGTSANVNFHIYENGPNMLSEIFNNGIQYNGSFLSYLTTGTRTVVAQTTYPGGTTMAMNGKIFTSVDNGWNMATVNQLQIGNGRFSSPISGTIRRITYWPRPITDATALSLLTSIQ